MSYLPVGTLVKYADIPENRTLVDYSTLKDKVFIVISYVEYAGVPDPEYLVIGCSLTLFLVEDNKFWDARRFCEV